MLDKDPSGLKVLANKTNSEVSKPLVAVEKSHHHHEENCKLSCRWTFKTLHRPRSGGDQDEKGDRVGGSTAKEGGEEDQIGETFAM